MFVSIIMGSVSDLEVLKPAISLLNEFGVKVDVKILSAHRTPKELAEYIEKRDNHVDVFITAAGLSAALPGVVASHTLKPVIGIPVRSGALQGMDALLSIVQMPPGIPVATVGINNAKNAALLALHIMGLKYPKIAEQLREYRNQQREKILSTEVNI